MDFAAIGESWAMGEVMARAGRERDSVVDEANRIIARKNDIIEDLERRLKVQSAFTEGLAMQSRETRAALAQVMPSHPILRSTGKRYGDIPRLACHLTFENHFDRKAKELGLPEPYSQYRPIAR